MTKTSPSLRVTGLLDSAGLGAAHTALRAPPPLQPAEPPRPPRAGALRTCRWRPAARRWPGALPPGSPAPCPRGSGRRSQRPRSLAFQDSQDAGQPFSHVDISFILALDNSNLFTTAAGARARTCPLKLSSRCSRKSACSRAGRRGGGGAPSSSPSLCKSPDSGRDGRALRRGRGGEVDLAQSGETGRHSSNPAFSVSLCDPARRRRGVGGLRHAAPRPGGGRASGGARSRRSPPLWLRGARGAGGAPA